jgi:CheY-like chemotaxis protein
MRCTVDNLPKVLVVDDDPAILEICSDLLQTEGYTVSVATNGQQALEQIRTDPPQVILMDIMMPVLDGVEACRQVKANPTTADIPVVLMSARTNLTRQSQELASADALVAKPFDIDHLLNTIHDLVGEDS